MNKPTQSVWVTMMAFSRRRLLSVWILLWLWLYFPVSGQATRYAGEFLRLGVGPKALAMGGAFTGLANDVTAGYWNPAGLVQLQQRQVAFMHAESFSGAVAYDYLGYVHPMGTALQKGALGVTLMRLGVDQIPLTALPDSTKPIDAPLGNGHRNRPYVTRYVSDAEYGLLLSYAQRISPRLALGGNVKLIHIGVGNNSAFGLGLDAGLHFQVLESLALGFTAMNATTTVLNWNTGRRETLNPIFKTGLAYTRSLSPLLGDITLAVDIAAQVADSSPGNQFALGTLGMTTHFGGAYRIDPGIALRAGSDAQRFTFGLGVSLPSFAVHQLVLRPELDYAFIGHNDLGTTHRIAASIQF